MEKRLKKAKSLVAAEQAALSIMTKIQQEFDWKNIETVTAFNQLVNLLLLLNNKATKIELKKVNQDHHTTPKWEERSDEADGTIAFNTSSISQTKTKLNVGDIKKMYDSEEELEADEDNE